MDVVSLIARTALGVVFIAAGAAKIAAPRLWRSQSASVGVPAAISGLVPWWELAVGASVVVGLAEPWPALAAVFTLVAFTAALARLLLRGQHPVCACFGAWSSAPVGPRSIVRNVALIALGAVAVLGVR